MALSAGRCGSECVEYSVNYISNESINESINDSINDLGLEILKTIKEYPGISAPKITLQIQKYDSSITL